MARKPASPKSAAPKATATPPVADAASGVQAGAPTAEAHATEAPAAEASAPAEPVQLRLTSARAPYTRGGLRFSSNRTPITVGLRDGLTEAQLLKLDEDTAITIEIVLTETGQAVTVPHGTFNAAERGDETAQAALAELQAQLTAPADKKGDDA